MESKKKGSNELICKTEIELEMSKTDLWLLGRQRGKGTDWGTGTDKDTVWASLGAQLIKNSPAMQETWV